MDLQILTFVAIGFLAQMVDGALGMAFGVIASSTLMATGAPPAIASAAVHAAEIVTTGLSGASHLWHKNVDRQLFWRLVITGMAGGVVGAYILTGLPEPIIKPIVTIYLAAMAVLIIARVLGWKFQQWHPPTPMIGAAGGFLDAIGGGGWGPLTASTLIAGGDNPRRAVGSVNLAEFFVTLTVSATFLATVGLDLVPIIAGLVLGGVVAAPFAALATRHIPDRPLMLLVGVVIVLLSLRELVRVLLG
jgi:uncharacterized protein